MKKIPLKSISISIIIGIAMTIFASSGLMLTMDNTLNDTLYQTASAPQGNVMVIGIDGQSTDDLGPFPWTRDVLASLIEVLNADPEAKPAVIGVDVIFSGESEPAFDDYLVDVVREGGNVVTAVLGNFTSELISTGEDFYMDGFYVDSLDAPFDALMDVSNIGHVNAMYDTDGVIRHSLLYLDLPNGTQVPSFALQIYNQYCDFYSIDKGFLPQTNDRHQWYLPFSATPGTYSDGFSVSKVISGEIPADIFAGSIVLIGPYAAGLKDHFITAIDHAEPMYGVEIQANTIDALINQNFKMEVNNTIQYVILFIMSVFCFLFFLERKVIYSTILWIAMSAGWLGLSFACYQMGYVLHSLWIPIAVTVLYVITVATNYVNATLEKIRVTNVFKKYVAPEIVAEILKEGADNLQLDGRATDIAVLFVDIRGFTPMSEVSSPQQVVAILNKYLTLTSSCIMKNGGTLDKFIGDATMAFWGAPLPQDDIIFKAVKAALDMVDESIALGEELQAEYGRTVSFGIGVHYGPAVVGNIGAEVRMDFTAIGDTVNTAARLESNAPAGKILISKIVADALEGRIITTSLGESIQLKGKSKGFEIFVVEGFAVQIK